MKETDVHKSDGDKGAGKKYKKLRFTWKHRSKSIELVGVRLRPSEYNVNWVLFGEKPKTKTKGKPKKRSRGAETKQAAVAKKAKRTQK